MLNDFWIYHQTIALAVFCSTNPPLGFITTVVILLTDSKIIFADANVCLKTDSERIGVVAL
ncbi:hypothetical protein [Nostoc sp. CHAB 5715]|uniref:hypothetical protein n=1 Tax=Nostoc sp. CHAB 5715 TaxID=2780400 RepID=UPI001E65ADEC|nr:hypothetical protein [Nostoc sp. CHAB 5715]MCC5620949.1 hypothetical protein [Nostoc sp. CHAB 5715]